MKSRILSRHYEGSIAERYDNHRRQSRKWQAEQQAVRRIFERFPDEMSVIDIPVGTGRFFEIYERKKCRIVGVDISEAMLMEAKRHPLVSQMKLELVPGDMFDLHFDDRSFDVSVCIRFLNLVEDSMAEKAVRELSRVSRRFVVLGARHSLRLRDMRVQTAKGAKMLALHIRSRIKKKMEGKVVFRRLAHLQKIFKEAGLAVSEKVCIENRKDGTDYYLYVLKKVGASEV